MNQLVNLLCNSPSSVKAWTESSLKNKHTHKKNQTAVISYTCIWIGKKQLNSRVLAEKAKPKAVLQD